MKKDDLKEGDIIVLFNHYHCPKRVVFCERLNTMALQNQSNEHVPLEESFNQNVRGNKMLSTFSFLPHYENNIEKIGYLLVK